MDALNNLYFKFFEHDVRLLIAFVVSVLLNIYIVPVILRISKAKRLFDNPDNQRKSHVGSVPTLGGLGFFTIISVVGLVMINTCGLSRGSFETQFTALPPMMAGLTILFFIGLKDDLLSISARKKLIAQIAAVVILIIYGDLRFTSLQGMFHIGDIRFIASFFLTLFAGIVITNSFNLIDGIDGLASSISMLASLVFGYLFYKAADFEYAILAAIVVGANIPFFYYNVFSKKNKIFMGDTGSLLLGFIMFVFVIRFNELNVLRAYKEHIVAAPSFSFAILILPLYDTLRVFAIRIMRGQSPFKADRRHLHHILIDLGLNHLQATAVLIGVNILFIAMAYFLNFLGNSMLLFIILGSMTVLSLSAVLLRRKLNKTPEIISD